LHVGFSFRTRIPITLDNLKRGATYRVVVTGEELAEHRDLLNQLASVELIRLRNESFVCARMYYVLVNGQEVRGNRIFFRMLPYFVSGSNSDGLLCSGSGGLNWLMVSPPIISTLIPYLWV